MTTPPRAELDRLVYRAGSEATIAVFVDEDRRARMFYARTMGRARTKVAAWRARTGRPSVQDTAPLPWAEPWDPDDDDIPF